MCTSIEELAGQYFLGVGKSNDLISTNANFYVCRVGVKETVALQVKANHIIWALVHDIADWQKLYHADLIFYGFRLVIGVI